MKKILLNIAALFMAIGLVCCSSGFNNGRAEEILSKENLDSQDYDALLRLYETGVDDAIRLSRIEPDKLTEEDRREVITVFSIGQRLSTDESKLSPQQLSEFQRINKKGTDELSK